MPMIDADALIALVMKRLKNPVIIGWLCRLIDEAPTIEAEPVRHGRWNDGDPYCPICRKDKFGGLDADVWSDWKPDYCPNCGCRMDGSADE